MKRKLTTALVICLVLALAFPLYAAPSTKVVDVVASATTNYTETTTSSPATTSAPVVAGETYKVKAGDVLWKIAKWHNLTLDQIKALNPDLKNINRIYVGQVLVVKEKMAEAEAPVETPETTAPVTTEEKLTMGLGSMHNFRARGTNYSFNLTNANVVFDAEGKIVKAFVDVYEISQAKGFTYWPEATPEATQETVAAQISGWQSKRELGDTYGMAKAATTKKEWYQQMDFYQDFFVGKTVAELRAWFDKNTGATGKPINPATTTNEAELAKLAALTEAEKAVLVDVVAGATMSLSDSHSLIIEALEDAYNNRIELKP